MEMQLKCFFMPSLEQMALRRVAALLWSDSDILASISKLEIPRYCTREMKKVLPETEDKIKDKTLKLELPEDLKKKLIDIIRPICLQVRIWKDIQEDYLSDDDRPEDEEYISLPNSAKLFWTTAGLIDYRKTAEGLLCCDALNAVQRYKLACVNCLEDHIPLLWEKLPEGSKKSFLRAEEPSPKLEKYWHCLEVPSPKLEKCWRYLGEISMLNYLLNTSDKNPTSFNQWAFEVSVENVNKTATEYFLQKLTNEEREASVMRAVEAVLKDRTRSKYLHRFKNEKLSELSCYLLSMVTPEQQMEILRENPGEVLLRFFDWPWPDLFSANIGLIWTFIPPSCYDDLMAVMAVRLRYSNYYFPEMFRELFTQSPLEFKKWFADQKFELGGTHANNLLSIFCVSGDSESVKIIFRNLDEADRLKLVSGPDVFNFFYYGILMRRRHMVEVCLREATPSEEGRKRWKEAFMRFLESTKIGAFRCRDPELKKFFDFLDGTDASADK